MIGCASPVMLILMVGCKNLLDVPIPVGAIAPGNLNSIAGAQQLRNQALIDLAYRYAGAEDAPTDLALQSGILADEFTTGGDSSPGDIVDRRVMSTAVGGYPDYITGASVIRQEAILAIAAIRQYHNAGYGPQVGEQFVIKAFVETLFAEDFCSGVPLSQIVPSGGIQIGKPVATAAMFAQAAADFDSATAQVTNPAIAPSDTDQADFALAPRVLYAAAVGKGRAELGLGNYLAASAATAVVPDSFAYSIAYQGGQQYGNYFYLLTYGPTYTISDREGGNGLPFRSANDPRLPIQNSGYTLNGDNFDTVYTTSRYASDGSSSLPLFTGVEARLIEAEAALSTGDVGTWLARLNHLRSTMVVGAADTTDPGTPAARLALTFYERGFWLFGTGHRLGDLRRLALLYGQSQSVVFPSGAYIYGADPSIGFGATYGRDIGFGIPETELATNPNATACASGT
jgi:hypothetical protein